MKSPCAVAVRNRAVLLLLASSLPAQTLWATDTTVDLDVGATRVEFTLAATMHTVHGTLKLKSGQLRFDPATGTASGVIIVDATSAETGNSLRDRKMHEEILESAKFPEIVFTPSQVKGSIARQGASQVQVSGTFRLHGQDHPVTMAMSVVPDPEGNLQASTSFPVPYVKWGLRNPSTFILHVSDTVDLEIHAIGHMAVDGR